MIILWAFIYVYLAFLNCSMLNYTLYQDSTNEIIIPEEYYESEDPFYLENSIRTIVNDIYPSMNFSQMLLSDYKTSFCVANPFQINIYKVDNIPMSNASKNFEFTSIKNYIYFFDTNQNLLVYQLVKNETGMESLVFVHEINTEYVAKESSFVRFFKDLSKNYLYLIIDENCYVFTTEHLDFPIFKTSFKLKLRENQKIVTASYTQGCFVFLFGNKYVDMFCINSIGSDFDVTESFMEKEITSQLAGTTNFSFNYTDLLINSDNVLIISDYNYGLIFINLNDAAKPLMMGMRIVIDGVIMIRDAFQSTVLIREVMNGSYINQYFEEYYTRFNVTSNIFYFDLNANYNLFFDVVKSLHISRNYVILLQSSSMKLYRHSMYSGLKPNFTQLQGALTNGIINVHRFEGNEDKNLFIAVSPFELSIYNIDVLKVSMKCTPPSDVKQGFYFLNISLYTSMCSMLENYENNFTIFPSCIYSIPALLRVYNSGAKVAENDKTGLIIGLVIGLLIALVLISICGYYLIKLSRRYNQLEEKKTRGKQVYLSGAGGVIGGYEDSEKQSSEPINTLEKAPGLYSEGPHIKN